MRKVRPIEDIAVVLPAYNEEKDLPALLDNLQAALDPLPYKYHIVVVDDGSKDRTAEIAEEAAKRMPVHLVRHPQNMGLGRAIETGLREAGKYGGAVITMDADNSHDPVYIKDMVSILENRPVELVIASRYQRGSKILGVSAFRQFLSLGCFALMKTLAPYRNVRDYSTGFRAYRASAIQKLVLRFGEHFVEQNGFSCMLEILLKLRASSVRVAEMPYTLRYDQKQGASKLRLFRTLRQYVTVIRNSFVWSAAPAPAARVADSRAAGQAVR